eukprot:TCALIF_05057-PB protein Name:"Protein of unknown function" AED:1.00 eAED:1.00 QI:0/0/0/0/0/0/2/0/78
MSGVALGVADSDSISLKRGASSTSLLALTLAEPLALAGGTGWSTRGSPPEVRAMECPKCWRGGGDMGGEHVGVLKVDW